MIRKNTDNPQPGTAPENGAAAAVREKPRFSISYWLTWLIALSMLTWLTYVVLVRTGVVSAKPTEQDVESSRVLSAAIPTEASQIATLPELAQPAGATSLDRSAQLHTIIPTRPRSDAQTYLVEAGDSVFGIAQKFKLKPETVLWANSLLLNDNPNMLSTEQNLTIPAADGILYKVKTGDTIESLAKKYKADPEDIVSWPSNKIDIADPQLVVGATILIPGGSREMQTWVIPTIWKANSGANKTVNVGCDTSGVNVMGSGAFLWPADNHSISGNTYWSGHLGIDIAAGYGAPVYAADSGVVVYAASIGGGYGLMVMIDHGNGFHTLYAHNSQIVASCGRGVSKGQVIAYAGSTGNSTGAHLHFEIRYLGSFVNPLDFVR